MSKPILSGELDETSGTIGGFRLGTDGITDLLDSFGLASLVTSADDVRFWAGATFENRATAPFRVTEAGVLSATSGTVGGFTLGASSLTGGSGSTKVTLNTTGSDGSGLVLGDNTSTTVTSSHAGSGFYVSENNNTLARMITVGSAGSRGGLITIYDTGGTATITLTSAASGRVTAGGNVIVGTWSGTPTLSAGDVFLSGYLFTGTYTGTALTSTGYVEIKDSGGTIRKVMIGT